MTDYLSIDHEEFREMKFSLNAAMRQAVKELDDANEVSVTLKFSLSVAGVYLEGDMDLSPVRYSVIVANKKNQKMEGVVHSLRVQTDSNGGVYVDRTGGQLGFDDFAIERVNDND